MDCEGLWKERAFNCFTSYDPRSKSDYKRNPRLKERETSQSITDFNLFEAVQKSEETQKANGLRLTSWICSFLQQSIYILSRYLQYCCLQSKIGMISKFSHSKATIGTDACPAGRLHL